MPFVCEMFRSFYLYVGKKEKDDVILEDGHADVTEGIIDSQNEIKTVIEKSNNFEIEIGEIDTELEELEVHQQQKENTADKKVQF